MKKPNFTKAEQELYDELIELSKTTKVRPKLINSRDSYQFIGNNQKENEDERWIITRIKKAGSRIRSSWQDYETKVKID